MKPNGGQQFYFVDNLNLSISKFCTIFLIVDFSFEYAQKTSELEALRAQKREDDARMEMIQKDKLDLEKKLTDVDQQLRLMKIERQHEKRSELLDEFRYLLSSIFY